ncbi:MAG: lectin-like protein [Plesiomonas sp.]|uniref:lectin-like protein n=1 Tax=Plesiomonas sp. TaxID=2486279 RepID=UPI003F3E21F2
MYTDLATIQHKYEADQLQNLALSHNLAVSTWIGLYNDANSWCWSMGDEPLGTFRKWFSPNPDNYLANEHCGGQNTNGWFDLSCTRTLPFICFDGKKRSFFY